MAITLARPMARILSRRVGVVLVALTAMASPIATAAPASSIPLPSSVVRASVPPFPGVLHYGSTGWAVTRVQKALLRKGFAIPGLKAAGASFGYYGKGTGEAVLAFKRANPALDLGSTPRVGPRTWAALMGGSVTPTPSPGGSGRPSTSSMRSQSPYAYTTPEYARWYAARRLAAWGWGASQMSCLRPMWIGESHWDYREVTGKYIGIPQTTVGVVNDYGFTESQYRSTPEIQVEVGLRYIKGRYGSPCAAWSFWKAQGAWQDSNDPTQWWGGWY